MLACRHTNLLPEISCARVFYSFHLAQFQSCNRHSTIGWLQFLHVSPYKFRSCFFFSCMTRYLATQDAWANPEASPRQAQFRMRGWLFSSGPSSRQIQHEAPSGAIGDFIRTAHGLGSVLISIFLLLYCRRVLAYEAARFLFDYVLPSVLAIVLQI